MHELSVTEGIFKICKVEKEKHNFEKVKEIRIKVGELTGLVPSCIEYYFAVISKDSFCEGAKIIAEKLPIEIKCKECSFSGVIEKGRYTCPSCSSNRIEITNGKEFYVDSLEVD